MLPGRYSDGTREENAELFEALKRFSYFTLEKAKKFESKYVEVVAYSYSIQNEYLINMIL